MKQSFAGIQIPEQRIPGLDGLRAVSILLVIWSHLLGTDGFLDVATRRWTGDLGVLGVRIFFVISGFLITTLLLDEWRRTGSISLKWFYFRRTLRIFPAMYAFVAIVGLLVWTGVLAIPGRDFIYASTYTMNFVAQPNWTLGHLWSLAVEEQFYILWPATLACLGPSRALKAAVAVVLITPLIRFASMYVAWADPLIGIAFPTIADPLAIGCILACVRERLEARTDYLDFLRSRRFWYIPLGVLLLNLTPGVKLHMLVTQSMQHILIAVIIHRYVLFPGTHTGLLLNAAPVRAIGVLSYSLYLWQQPFLNHTVVSPATWFPLNILAALACAYASYRLVEKPCLDLRQRLERRWKQQRAVSVTLSQAAAG